MFAPKKLNQRLALHILAPLAILLLAMGVVGYIFARNSMLVQWREASILKLQRAAHQVDMHLKRPKALLNLFQRTAGKPEARPVRKTILTMLRNTDGVVRVDLAWESESDAGVRTESRFTISKGQPSRRAMAQWRKMMRFHRGSIMDMSSPLLDAQSGGETVALVSRLEDESGRVVGRIEVILAFQHIMRIISDAGWWQSHKAFLVDKEGKIITGADMKKRGRLGDNQDSLEIATGEAIRENNQGTVSGAGNPPEEVSGFYGLEEAPWVLVMIAPGREILSPILQFRNYYFAAVVSFIILVVVLARLTTRSTLSSIKDVSVAAGRVAKGVYEPPLAPGPGDEVGELVHSFNIMIRQLKERSKLKEAMNLAMEVQQSLLPRSAPRIDGLDIAGKTIYCDETGGDYYDFLKIGPSGFGVAVGDVSGHGISSALLMASMRAFLRLRRALPGDSAEVITDVNRQVAHDCEETGNFITLFYLAIDLAEKKMQWVRAGHDPALLYDPSTDSFEELGGPGVALGLDEEWDFSAQEKTGLGGGWIILLGTDGIWEARNAEGDMFGKKPLYDITRRHHDSSAREILDHILRNLMDFQDQAFQDDVTLVALKITSDHF